jgi:hypothetical protein
MAHQLLDGAKTDLFMHEVCAEGFSETGWVVWGSMMEKGIVGTEDGVYGFGGQSIPDPIAKEERPRELISHSPIVAQYYSQKRMGEEGETLAYREHATSFAGNAYCFLVKIDIIYFDFMYLRTPQTTGDAEGKDTQVPTMNEQRVLVIAAATDAALVVFLDAAQQSHEIEW